MFTMVTGPGDRGVRVCRGHTGNAVAALVTDLATASQRRSTKQQHSYSYLQLFDIPWFQVTHHRSLLMHIIDLYW